VERVEFMKKHKQNMDHMTKLELVNSVRIEAGYPITVRLINQLGYMLWDGVGSLVFRGFLHENI
jgi:hypothetical protein